MMFQITYKIADVERLNILLSKLDEIGESVAVFLNSRLLSCDSDSNKLFEELFPLIDETDHIMIVPIDKKTLQGYLNSNTVNWIKEHE